MLLKILIQLICSKTVGYKLRIEIKYQAGQKRKNICTGYDDLFQTTVNDVEIVK